jgi:hypothetical protein
VARDRLRRRWNLTDRHQRANTSVGRYRVDATAPVIVLAAVVVLPDVVTLAGYREKRIVQSSGLYQQACIESCLYADVRSLQVLSCCWAFVRRHKKVTCHEESCRGLVIGNLQTVGRGSPFEFTDTLLQSAHVPSQRHQTRHHPYQHRG